MNILEKVAKKHGTTEEEVRKEISVAIRVGMRNPDPKVQETWKMMFPNGKEPTPEEFICVLSQRILRSGGC